MTETTATTTIPSETSKDTLTRSKVNAFQSSDLCVVCGHISNNGVTTKYRISEKNRAKTFFDATRALKDDVFIRTAHITDFRSVFAADIHYHDRCMKKYLRKYNSVTTTSLSPTVPAQPELSEKRRSIYQFIETILPQLRKGMGYTLTYVSRKLNARNRR